MDIKTYFTFANMQTPQGWERLSTILKLFTCYLNKDEIEEMNLGFDFYKDLLAQKPKSKYIVFGIVDSEFGIGVFTKEDIKKGKAISKTSNYLHLYLSIDCLIIFINAYLAVRYENKRKQLLDTMIAQN